MGADEGLGLINQLLWNALLVSAPVLGAALLVGLVISVLQVATQLQEMTLSYVPKMLVTVLVLIALGPWMLGRITAFAIATIKLIPQAG
ncbi:MAG TPA: flagellar biosynthesis protein FliQ [Phenylobacterium sp.]